jgi:glycosyltransferase involved in cell wall biosynthesis
MKIAFLSDSYVDPERVGSWSGLPYAMAENFRAAGCEVVAIRGRDGMSRCSEKLRQAYWKWGRGKRYLRGLSPELLQEYADSVREPLRQARADIIFSTSTWLISRLETNVPIVFWSDATFARMLGFYQDFTNLSPCSIEAGHAAEREALRRCALAVYAVDWAARSAREDYGVDPGKIRLLPFGSSMAGTPSEEEEPEVVRERTAARERCELLFIGVNWERKGAAVAVEALAELRRRGIASRLRIAGCRPPRGFGLPEGVELVGFLDKSTTDGAARLRALYRESHFFLLPSRAEAAAVVLSEACSFGLPCLCTDVGGLSEIVHAGANGMVFPLAASGAAYADWIAEKWAAPAEYARLSRDTFAEYRARLEGRACAAQLVDWMRDLHPAETLAAS